MGLPNRLIRILAALVIALPMGQGGICCCLLGEADMTQAAMPEHSCCPSGAESAASSAAEDEEECSCPVRDSAVLASAGSTHFVAAPQSEWAFAPLSAESSLVSLTEGPTPAAPPAPPAPVPLFRTLQVIRC